ncbi:MAG TPA: hypothetical protein VFP37_06235 [Steroidobacteraceae bacterium]|nr:hypothetical protein [Steroidobacteraceae bacterium]
MASPELAAEVEMERRLRRGIASAARRGWLKRGQTYAPPQKQPRWNMALAASVVVSVITVGAGALLAPRAGVSETEVSASPTREHLSPPRTVRLASVRGLGTSPDITFSRSDAPGSLTVQPEVVVLTCADGSFDVVCACGGAPDTPQYPEYELELVNRNTSALAWRSPRQIPTDGALLSFVVQEPDRLEAGNYDMIVRGLSVDHEEIVARFWLRVGD